jgi:hypothetical protein
MGTVIDFVRWRERAAGSTDAPLRQGRSSAPADGADPIGRLDQIVSRLDPLLEEVKKNRKRDLDTETEILAITGALSLGMTDEAAERAERLAARLESRTGRRATPPQQ